MPIDGGGMHLGSHWIAEVSPISTHSLVERGYVERFLDEMPSQLNLNVLYPPSIQQGEDGAVRGVVLLSESHASAHTDPKNGIVYVDLFSCTAFEQAKAREILLSIWPGEVVLERFIRRGTR